MRIVLDLQGAQTGSRHRGIGRYSLSLAKAIVRQARGHEVLIALNGSFPESIESIRATFDSAVPQKNIHVWHTVGRVSCLDPDNDTRRRAAELVREAFLASLKPDVVHISSLFEGLSDNAVTSVGSFSSCFRTAVTLYDLIPHIYRKPYLDNPVIAKWYEGKLDHLRRADMLLAISESSRNEALKYLGFAEDESVNISAATEEHFYPLMLDADASEQIKNKYGLVRPFIMYTGGIDHRKNIEGLIEAYASLPEGPRKAHQLAIVCAVQPDSRADLERFARKLNLGRDEVVITGFVPEHDLVMLYNLCKLFVFPSWHEGFGLPALEAMRCGAPVIGANTSSLPEVIGRKDALFDPHSLSSMRSKILHALTDDEFRADLSMHGQQQAATFSWDATGKRAINAFEKLHARFFECDVSPRIRPARRLTLAYVSPLPPERSGIASYSLELLPELTRYYRVIAVVRQKEIPDPWINANCLIRGPEWLEEHAHEVDRVLYHFGNSEFHEHMFGLIETVPGVVVLHDFFLSGIHRYREMHGLRSHVWTEQLYYSHGYKAVGDRCRAEDEAGWQYPVNLQVLQQAQGIIVHSEASRRLAADWYGDGFSRDWAVIPHLRVAITNVDADKQAARSQLKLPEDGLIVCSFGLIGPTKLNHRLLSAWCASRLVRDPRCILIFVGENNDGEYGRSLLRQIRSSNAGDRIRITGWTDSTDFRKYLEAADVGVQLRTLSRGETSGTVLDCLNHGLATIVNANGSMADICESSVWKLADAFSDEDLIAALETLASDPEIRGRLGKRGRQLIEECHDPRKCVDQYHAAIESFAFKARTGMSGLLDALSYDEFIGMDQADVAAISGALAANFRMPGLKQLLVDVSSFIQRDSWPRMQQSIGDVLRELIESPPIGFRVEPVFARKDRPGYIYARSFTSEWMGCPSLWAQDEPIDCYPGDVFLDLGLQQSPIAAQKGCLDDMRNRGVMMCFIIYYLLPISKSEFFSTDTALDQARWLNIIDQYDKIITISKSMADDLVHWLGGHVSMRQRPLGVDWFHLGMDADLEESMSDHSISQASSNMLPEGLSFLVTNALGSSQGIALVLDVFERLWASGVDANLIIVEETGRLADDLIMRLRTHPQNGKRLFREGQVDDQRLEQLYSTSTCLIAVDKTGWNVPTLIKAARHGLALMVRNDPMLREILGEHAYYFDVDEADGLAQSIEAWLALYAQGNHPQSVSLSWPTIAQSAACLGQVVIRQDSYASWMPAVEHCSSESI